MTIPQYWYSCTCSTVAATRSTEVSTACIEFETELSPTVPVCGGGRLGSRWVALVASVALPSFRACAMEAEEGAERVIEEVTDLRLPLEEDEGEWTGSEDGIEVDEVVGGSVRETSEEELGARVEEAKATIQTVDVVLKRMLERAYRVVLTIRQLRPPDSARVD